MKTFALTAILALISSLSLTAKEPASFDGNRLTYTEGGQTFNFRRIGVIGNEKYIIFGKMEYIRISNNDASFSVTMVHRFR